MSEMIERVATAIFNADEDGSWAHGELQYRALARAAIEAMREPTKDMCDNGYYAANYRSFSIAELAEQPRNIWRTMIDTALKSQPVDA